MGKKSLEEKINDVDQFFLESVQGSDAEELKKKLIALDSYEGELSDTKEDDEDLKDKIEIAKEAGAVYRDGFKAIKLKRQFLLRVLKDKGAI
jgi:hypothetical protein